MRRMIFAVAPPPRSEEIEYTVRAGVRLFIKAHQSR